jgi:hypothetical protein
VAGASWNQNDEIRNPNLEIRNKSKSRMTKTLLKMNPFAERDTAKRLNPKAQGREAHRGSAIPTIALTPKALHTFGATPLG